MITFDPEKHEYYTEDGVQLPSVTTILQEMGEIDRTYYTEDGAERGKAVHEAISLNEKEVLEPKYFQDSEIWPYIEAFTLFKIDTGWRTIKSEIIVASPPLYAGTLDLVGAMRADEKKWIIDIKTGSLAKWHGLQLAAYCNAYSLSIDKRGVLLLKNNGKYSLVTEYPPVGKFTDKKWLSYWEAILQHYHWRKIK